jgi:hypothetical protein
VWKLDVGVSRLAWPRAHSEAIPEQRGRAGVQWERLMAYGIGERRQRRGTR